MLIDTRSRIAAQERRLAALLRHPGADARPQIRAMARRVTAAWATEPAAAEALRLGGAIALSALLAMKAAARDPALRAFLSVRGAA